VVEPETVPLVLLKVREENGACEHPRRVGLLVLLREHPVVERLSHEEELDASSARLVRRVNRDQSRLRQVFFGRAAEEVGAE